MTPTSYGGILIDLSLCELQFMQYSKAACLSGLGNQNSNMFKAKGVINIKNIQINVRQTICNFRIRFLLNGLEPCLMAHQWQLGA